MTVRELIEHLQTLDQDRGIWVCYDGGAGWFKPIPDGTVTTVNYNYDPDDLRVGDYMIDAS